MAMGLLDVFGTMRNGEGDATDLLWQRVTENNDGWLELGSVERITMDGRVLHLDAADMDSDGDLDFLLGLGPPQTEIEEDEKEAGGLFWVKNTADHAPVITQFVAENAALAAGQETTLRWKFLGLPGAAVTIEPSAGVVGEVAGQSIRVRPDETTTYRLKATTPNGTTEAELTVLVNQVPAIHSFTAESTIDLDYADRPKTMVVALQWDAENFSALHLEPGIGQVHRNSLTQSYSLMDWPDPDEASREIEFVLRATNGVGAATARAQVTLHQRPVIHVTALPTVSLPGEPVRLSWTVTPSTSQVMLQPGNQPLESAGSLVVFPDETVEYTFEATNGDLTMKQL